MNKVMLIGKVAHEPEVRYFGHGQAVARVVLMTTECGQLQEDGTRLPDHNDWHTVLLYRNLAKIVEEHVAEGDRLYVEGRLRYRSYVDRSGQEKKVAEIQADNLEMLT